MRVCVSVLTNGRLSAIQPKVYENGNKPKPKKYIILYKTPGVNYPH